jgi:hypothetical protein
MRMLGRRLQILLDDERYERIAEEAARRRVPIAVVVRDAIDAALSPNRAERAAAGRAILAAAPMPVPSPEELRAELDVIREGGL